MSQTICVINPNTSEAMRQVIETSCQQVALNDTQLKVVCAPSGVASVEGFYDGALATVGVLESLQSNPSQGYLIACADDTGLDACREITSAPVLGIGEAAMHTATLLGAGFSVLTAQQKSVHILERNAHQYGFATHCRGVHAMKTPVLDLEKFLEPEWFPVLLERCQQILEQDESEVLVLGCAGLTILQQKLQDALQVPVIDGVRAGISLIEGLLRCGLSTSKHCTYQPAEDKTTAGEQG